jgi:cytochrome P450
MTSPAEAPLIPVRFEETPDGSTRPTVDLFMNLQHFTENNYRIYDELRSQCPVAWATPDGGFWFLTDYASVFDATLDDDLFISSAGTGLGQSYDSSAEAMGPIPIEIDPPDTAEYRRVTMSALSPKAVEGWESDIRRMTNELIDEFIESGEGDLVKQLTTPLPARTALLLLGLPDKDWPEWVAMIHGIIHGDHSGHTDEEGGGYASATGEVFARVAGEIERRTAAGEPGDDLLGRIMTVPVNGAPMSFMEQIRYVFLVLLGGMDTTSGLTGNSIIQIQARPDVRERLIADRTLLRPAMEEFLRHGTPTQGLKRTVSRDTEFYGQQMKAGDQVMLMWAAANRDPKEFTDPNEIDIDRPANRHMSFGIGQHRCLGSNVARTMYLVMMDEVFNRLPDFQITVDEVPFFPNATHVFAPSSIPVRFTPGPRVYPAES